MSSNVVQFPNKIDKDLLIVVNCNNCGSDRWNLLRTKKLGWVLRCEDCELFAILDEVKTGVEDQFSKDLK